ncbi:transcription antitermination factor NusB [uncultured Psychrobacter sp.]|uniref:transcription antitermination factor NusB n=1 Tax=uncultured Psychrobacter sp. TaxID=259303 RepID=UPI00261157DB|nr:transcription antitermination factor NusB [uncultured Psychrobacter sp.]
MTDQLKRAINAAKTAQANDEQAEATRIASSSAGEQTFDMSESSYKTSHTAVRKARRFAMQGLYEWLVTDRRFDIDGKLGWKDNAPHDIAARTRATNAMHTVHIGYYHEMMRDIPEQIEALDALISQHLDRGIDKLDTVEHAILLIGAYELQHRLEIPYKVVLDEAMKLNNHFGATDAHKLINAVLDKMATELRAIEVQADSKASRRPSQTADQSDKPKAQSIDSNKDAAQTATDDTPTASSKPRISANNATVKRERSNKARANINEFNTSKKQRMEQSSAQTHDDTESKPVAGSTSADVGLHDSNLVNPDEKSKD